MTANGPAAGRMSVEVVIPVYNEEHDLPRCIERLHAFLGQRLENPWRITIADNGSTDRTLAIAQELAERYSNTGYVHLPEKGRGRALRHTWLATRCDIVCYMDVDLSTSLEDFPKLVQALEEGYDVVTGSRLARGARTTRSLKREVISRCYNALVWLLFQTRIRDMQCGFKAIRREAAQRVVPVVKDQAWFFDTELLLVAERRGLRVKEVPVAWVEDPDTRVKVLRTAWQDIKGLLRLRFGGIPQLAQPQPVQQA